MSLNFNGADRILILSVFSLEGLFGILISWCLNVPSIIQSYVALKARHF